MNEVGGYDTTIPNAPLEIWTMHYHKNIVQEAFKRAAELEGISKEDWIKRHSDRFTEVVTTILGQ